MSAPCATVRAVVARVVIDTRSIVEKRSGIGNYTETLVKHLVPLATDIDFLLLRHPDMREPLVEASNVRELHFPGETKSTATVFRLGRAHSFADYDLYHSPGDLVPLGLRCPWVVTTHDMMWLEAPKLASGFLPVRLANGLWYRWTIGNGLRGARRVIAISQATADGIARVFPEEVAKVRVVHHGIDRQRYYAGQGGARERIGDLISPNFRYSLIVGQGSPYKNHDGMIRAFVDATRDEPDHKLVLLRRFSRVDRAMQRLLRQPEVRDKVITVPFVPDDTLLTLYRHAEMVLFVSHYEGFGLPALEAMALGAPVLASTSPAVAEITGDGALHVGSRDHAGIVEGIRRLSSDAVLRKKVAAAGQRRAEDFSWARCAEQTLAVYREALSSETPSAAGSRPATAETDTEESD